MECQLPCLKIASTEKPEKFKKNFNEKLDGMRCDDYTCVTPKFVNHHLVGLHLVAEMKAPLENHAATI